MVAACRLSVRDLAVPRDGRTVLHGVSFALDAGQMLEVRGPNGIGKSTLLRAVAGFLPRAAGVLEWDEPSAPGLPLQERLHYLGHSDGLKSALTCRENLRFAKDLFGADGAAPDEAARRVGLADLSDLPAAYLSAGQRRRLALARLLVAHRPLWLLDEPLTALDQDGQVLLGRLVADHLAGGGVVVAATHATLDVPGALTLSFARSPDRSTPVLVEDWG